MTRPHFALAVHGGAGTILKHRMTPEQEDAFHAGLCAALVAGHTVLADGGSALDAVTAAVVALEDDPRFNAGRGAVFNADGGHEMDAAVMDGCTRAAGAIAGVCGPRNPVLAARAVMERSGHVLLAGPGALRFCREQGLAFADDAYFFTEHRWQALLRERERLRLGLPEEDEADEARRHGTVGAVALDAHGHLAAATSTGGMTHKAPGRVGDSPVIGAGTWADDRDCAVSATGHGEWFIRHAVAHEIAARIRLAGQSLARAAHEVVVDELGPLGGSGGLVAVDRTGHIALPFNCAGMYRGFVREDGVPHTAIYAEAYRTG